MTAEGDEKTLGDCHDVYLTDRCSTISRCFIENFQDTCLKHYQLDPAHFYTAPGLAWTAALKVTKIKFELLTDYYMFLMFEKGIRNVVSHRQCTGMQKRTTSTWEINLQPYGREQLSAVPRCQ